MKLSDMFKKKEKENLDTPKNLPELAKDMLEQQPENAVPKEVPSENVKDINDAEKTPSTENYRIPTPSSTDVPRLDLNLIRSSNIHIPHDTPVPDQNAPSVAPYQNMQNRKSSQQTIDEDYLRRNMDIILSNNLRRDDARAGAQSRIYINRGRSLFDDIESALATHKDEAAHEMLRNILPLLYEYHDVESMGRSERLKELKDLEKFWTLMQKKNYAMKTVVDSLESDILRKSRALIEPRSISDGDSAMIEKTGEPIASKDVIGDDRAGNSRIFANTFTTSSIEKPLQQPAPTFVPILKKPLHGMVVNPAERFYFKDGRVASSLKELYYMINEISDDTFYHHVTSEKNDFASWVRDVLKEYTVANEMSTIYSRRELAEFLKDKF